jgi:hypothetical protein
MSASWIVFRGGVGIITDRCPTSEMVVSKPAL